MSSPTEGNRVVAPYRDHGLECPFCCAKIEIDLVVMLEDVHVRKAGSTGFNKPVFSTNIISQIAEVKINHVCKGPKEYDDK